MIGMATAGKGRRRRAAEVAAGLVVFFLATGCALLGDIEERTLAANAGGAGTGGADGGSACVPRCEGNMRFSCDPSGVEIGESCGVDPCHAGACASVTELALGHDHSCALLDDGGVLCWGSNLKLQRGVADAFTPPTSAPTEVPGLPPVMQIEAGSEHTCALTRDGRVFCWGANGDGQLGQGTASAAAMAAEVVGLTDVEQLGPGSNRHSCAIGGGAAWCWGSNLYAELGDGVQTATPVATPTLVQGVANPSRVTQGCSQTCAIGGATLSCFGWNEFGQVGIGSAQTAVLSPSEVTLPSAVLDARLGCTNSCALVQSGHVYCWGNNDQGFLGLPAATAETDAPTAPVSGLDDVVDVRPGGWIHSARRSNGEVACWGRSEYGAAGQGTTNLANHYTAVIAIGVDAQWHDSGWLHICAKQKSGEVVCWGRNDSGQLGDGTPFHRGSPAPVIW
jgi:alpha-tubulin suppressor-like RCC1 family protein